MLLVFGACPGLSSAASATRHFSGSSMKSKVMLSFASGGMLIKLLFVGSVLRKMTLHWQEKSTNFVCAVSVWSARVPGSKSKEKCDFAILVQSPPVAIASCHAKPADLKASGEGEGHAASGRAAVKLCSCSFERVCSACSAWKYDAGTFFAAQVRAAAVT